MSKFKLLKNWNGHFKGEEVVIQDHLDSLVIFNKIGEKVKESQPESKQEVPAQNKAIVPKYEKKPRKTRTK